MKRTFLFCLLLVATALVTRAQTAPKGAKAFFELRTYQLKFGTPGANLDNYLKDALIPALNRHGVQRIGVFREMGKTDPPKVYLLIPYQSAEQFMAMTGQLRADSAFARASRAYNALPPEAAPYARYSSSLMTGFDGFPQLVTPPKGAKLFELRTYEGYSEDAVRRKTKMFNDEEFPVFDKTGLHSVFFGEVIAGDHMPCLTYLLAFTDMAERDANWKAFSDHPDWKRMVKDPQYANSVSNIIRVFLEPVGYSQL